MDNTVNYVPQIDYTSRDYSAIREDLLALIDVIAPTWTSRDPADLGMTLVELFSYMGDMLGFYIDRAANEGLLATSSQRDSVLQIAAMIGYVPTASSAATVTLTFSNTTESSVVVPAGTQVANSVIVDGTSTQIVFETDAAVTVPAAVDGVAGTITAAATQGETIADEEVGTSTGAPSQVYKLANYPVIKDSIEIYVNGIQYTYTSSLIENGIYDPVFSTENDANGETYIIFGDGISGRIPPTSGSITSTYRVGNGADGNINAGTLENFLTNSDNGLSVTNLEAATGGSDEESTDSIRTNAPLAMRTNLRAVSLKDYGYLALQVSGVAKAIAESDSFNSINLYVAPFGDTGLAAGGGASAAFNALAEKVILHFTDKAAPNVSLTVLPPTYVQVDSDITVHILPQYRQDIVIPQAEAAVKALVSIENSFFADRIPSQYLMRAISAVPGVEYSTVDYLRRTDEEQNYSVTSWTRATNIMTITVGTHTITAGQTVYVTSSDTNISGSHVVTAVASTTISFGSVGTNAGPTSVTSSTVRAIVVETIECAVNEVPSAGTFTLTASGGIA